MTPMKSQRSGERKHRMERAQRVIVRACSWLAARAGAWIIGLAVIWMASSPLPMWGQWNGTNPVLTNSNVGIGTQSALTKLAIGNGSLSDSNVPLQMSAGGALAYLGVNRTDGQYAALFGGSFQHR